MKNRALSASIITHDAIPGYKESNFSSPVLNCQIDSSSLTCLVGPYRAQLRAYLLMLAGISKPERGKVVVLGQETSKLDPLARRKLRCQIGYFSGVSPLLSIQHGLMNVMLPALYHANLPLHVAADKARTLLAELDCHIELTTFPAQLNGFQRAQLALARALILDPSLLILDVPFNDLGAKEREKMGELLVKQQHRAVCMIGGLQYPHFLEQHADQIIFISEHEILSFSSWKSFIQTEDKGVQVFLSVL